MNRPENTATVKRELKERVKELNCLYRLTRLLNEPRLAPDEVLQTAAESLPEAWQFPEVAAARIVHGGSDHRSPGFAETPWTQSAEIVVSGRPAGRVEICDLEPRPESDIGPFLAEEETLLEALAEHLGRYIERAGAQETLELNEARLNSLLRLFQRLPE